MVSGRRVYFRSSWEANYARFLQFLKDHRKIREWEYEPCTFWFEGIRRGTVSYKPDFRVQRLDGTVYYVEIKGFMDAGSRLKLKRMRKYHPMVEVDLVGAKQYRALAGVMQDLLPEWELTKREVAQREKKEARARSKAVQEGSRRKDRRV